MSKVSDLYRIAERADAAWSKEGQRLFGRAWGDVRYTKEAHGTPGSELARLYTAWTAARDAWRAERDRRDVLAYVEEGLGEN